MRFFQYGILSAIVLLTFGQAEAATESVLYRFSITVGINPPSPTPPQAGVVIDETGALYGELAAGGPSVGSAACGKQGCGTVYKLTPLTGGRTPWPGKVIYAFVGGQDGSGPAGGLVRGPDGALYGVTESGGQSSCACGTVFRLTPPAQGSMTWTKQTLYSFTGGPSGSTPRGGLVMDNAGALYGTTFAGGGGDPSVCRNGGAMGCGTIFKLTPPTASGGDWTQTVLYVFTGDGDGRFPQSALIFNSRGGLYGETYSGYTPDTTVFLLAPKPGLSTYTFKVLHTFNDGKYSLDGPLLLGPRGVLYGTANSFCTSPPDIDCGAIYQLTPPTSGHIEWTFSLVYEFSYDLANGDAPGGGVIAGPNGSLFGTTSTGGRSAQDVCCGTVFSLTPPASGTGPWARLVLYRFAGQPDGQGPTYNTGLMKDLSGALYGTTIAGGSSGNRGVVYRVIP